LVEDGEIGGVFPADDTGALTRVIDRLADDEDRRYRMGRAARSRIEEWSIPCAARRVERAVLGG
jgi:glycosyltransferase involved in cell wall biosynthesis